MVKMVALYNRPEDIDAFMQHYENVHLPIIRNMPGLVKLEMHRMFSFREGTESNPFLMAEMTFESRDALKAAMKSDAGRDSAKDLQEFAGELVQIFFSEVSEEELVSV